MKISFKLNFPGLKKKLDESVAKTFQEYLQAEERKLSEAPDEPKLRIQLSVKAARKRQALAYQVRDRNSSQYQSIKSGAASKSSPPPLSLGLPKPDQAFDAVIEELEKNPSQLLAAHEDPDRERSLELLS